MSKLDSVLKVLTISLYIYGVYLLLFKTDIKARRVAVKSLSSVRAMTNKSKFSLNNFINTKKLLDLPIVSQMYRLILAQNFKGRYTNELVVLLFIFLLFLSLELFSVLPLSDRIIYSACMTLSPIPLLLARLWKNQSKGSLEGEAFLSDFLGHYKVTKSMPDSLELCLLKSSEDSIIKGSIANLLADLRDYRTKEELVESLAKFEYSLGTRWAKKLSIIIRSDVNDGIDQTRSLESLLKDLDYGRTLYEDTKRFNAESITLIKFVVPMTYIGSILMAVYYLDITLSKYIYNQFFEPTGVKFFAVILISQIANLTILYYLNNDRMDIMG